jgi:hypothetical protein
MYFISAKYVYMTCVINARLATTKKENIKTTDQPLNLDNMMTIENNYI